MSREAIDKNYFPDGGYFSTLGYGILNFKIFMVRFDYL